MFTYLQPFPRSARQRRQALNDADRWITSAEILPKVALAFFLLVLPFLVTDTLLTDWGAFLWWVKGWTPVWIGVIALLYFSIGLVIAPQQLSGASIEAMTQVSDEQELIPSPQAIETPCPFTPLMTESDDREVKAVTQMFWQQICCRMTKLPQRHFPTRRIFPQASLRDALA